jgi:hypothetical protein
MSYSVITTMFGFAYTYPAKSGTVFFQLSFNPGGTFQGEYRWTPKGDTEVERIAFSGTYVHMSELSVKLTVNSVDDEPHSTVHIDMLSVDDMEFKTDEYEDPVAPINGDDQWNGLVFSTTPMFMQGKMSVPLARPLKGKFV